MLKAESAYAEPEDEVNTTVVDDSGASAPVNNAGDAGNNDNAGNTNSNGNTTVSMSSIDNCQSNLGGMAWLVCTITGTTSNAVDWLYEAIEGLLVVNPVEARDGTPIYEIWKYCRGVTNIVFIVFLLIVIYSQITGVGISNYGLKKALPKLIVAAVLVNLSFLICQLGIDLSNVIGNGLRGLFTGVENSVVASMEVSRDSIVQMRVAYAEIYNAIAAGSVLAIGAGVLSFESGAIWMLIPVILGALVAVISGLITIALRQAVVALLVMIAPLAIVAMILPNTEGLFKKWKKLLIQMLVFYPMFSLLFGASSLAGFAIMASAKDGFWLILGAAVQVFPLFFSWSLMKMSGTVLGSINARIRGFAARPLAGSRAWADERRQATKSRMLASGRVYTPSLALRQYLANRKVARGAETVKHDATTLSRGLAYRASKHYDKNGAPTKKGANEYETQAVNMVYERIVARDENNMNKGLGQLEATKLTSAAMRARLAKLDDVNVKASDELKMEKARGAMIEFDNARGFQNRISDAITAEADRKAIENGDRTRKLHGLMNSENLARYEAMRNTMEGKEVDTHFVGADAAHAFSAQSQIVRGKFQNYFDLTVPTQDVVHRLEELTNNERSSEYIDPIIAGLRTLNMRGDTDLVRGQVANMLENKKMELGTYASQSLASFLMFDVKGNDPFLRRMGKYLNLETANIYNDREEADLPKRRTRKDVSMYEYVNGEYVDEDENGNVIYENGKPRMRKSKRGAAVLLKGTSFKDMERTAIANMTESIRNYSVDPETGEFDYDRFKKNEKAIWDAIMPNVIGDHFSFLSGSEQIVAFGKGLTGVDVGKHRFDWEGIFGEELAKKLTPEQKQDYIEFLNARTKAFLGGQVPAQIAKTKSDMLESIRNQYALRDLIEENKEEIKKNPDLLDKIMEKVDGEMTGDEYKAFEKEHLDNVKKEFVGSFKEDALKGFVKMHHKGYQGEAKDGLIQLLNPDALYDKFFPYGENGKRDKRERRVDEDEDGKPADMGDAAGGAAGVVHNGTSAKIKDIFDDYRGTNSGDVEGFWERAKHTLESSDEVILPAGFVEDVEEILPSFTSVAALYSYIMNSLFGGV